MDADIYQAKRRVRDYFGARKKKEKRQVAFLENMQTYTFASTTRPTQRRSAETLNANLRDYLDS